MTLINSSPRRAAFVALTLAPAFAFALAAASPVAAGEAAVKARVDAEIEPLVAKRKINGASVGVIAGGERHTFGYGRLWSAPAAPTPDADTVYEIGSITKVFTGLLLSDMVARGEAALDDPVARYLPASVTLVAFDGREVTLRDLATHTSALPRLPSNLAPKDPANPYADYTVEQLYAFLASWRPAHRPGEGPALYSNLGVGLLGHALARRAGKSWEDLFLERIGAPLGMKSTRVTLTPDLRRRLAPGHDALGRMVANWDIPTLAGAGALRSTVSDMLLFLEANLAPDARESLPWQPGLRPGVFWHNGGTGGYHAFAAIDRTRKVAVVVLSNSAREEIDTAGSALMKALAE